MINFEITEKKTGTTLKFLESDGYICIRLHNQTLNMKEGMFKKMLEEYHKRDGAIADIFRTMFGGKL